MKLAMRHAFSALLGVAAAVAVTVSAASAAGAAPTVKVWFLQGEQMIAVTRPGSTAQDAIAQLLAGPTPAEVKRGIRTYVSADTPFNSVSVANGVATVDLGVKFVQGRNADSLRARLSQLVYTATGPGGAKKVRLLVDGGTPLGLFPGVYTAGPVTVTYLRTPDVPAPVPAAGSVAPASGSARTAQTHLVQLGYLPSGGADGRLGPATKAAILAFQKWEGLSRDGVLGPQTQRRLQTAQRPRPITRGSSGKRIEVLLDRQVALAIENNRVVRVVHVSTGKPSTPTPPGNFTVYAKYAKWWSTPFREWLLWAVPFNAGIALHEFAEVPPTPASHGCVRQTNSTARWMYDFSRVGMPVKVVAHSR